MSKTGPAAPQAAGPLDILYILFLYEVAYFAMAAISSGVKALS